MQWEFHNYKQAHYAFDLSWLAYLLPQRFIIVKTAPLVEKPKFLEENSGEFYATYQR